MPPKKTSTGAAKKATATHPSYLDMIKEAVISLKERNGSSRQAVKKYVLANNSLGNTTDNAFSVQFNKALLKGSENGTFTRPKGASGPVKLAAPASKTASKPAAAKPAAKAPAAKKTIAAKKTTATKKAAAPKKTTPAKTKTTAAKKTTTKAKANTATKRKTPATAPAVEEKAPVVLGKTKSGRVTKSNAPQPAKSSAPKKKAAATKKAAPKKATPKKA